MRLLSSIACVVGIVSSGLLLVNASEVSQPLSEKRLNDIYGGTITKLCYVNGTTGCQSTTPKSDCTNTACVNNACPANTNTVIISQQNYANVSSTNNSGSGGSNQGTPIYCTTTTTCNGCTRPAFNPNYYCSTGTATATNTDQRVPTTADNSACTGPGGS